MKRRPRARDFAVGVATSPDGADFWHAGDPYRLSAVVRAADVVEACGLWRRLHGSAEDFCFSLNAAHVDVVRLREEERACGSRAC